MLQAAPVVAIEAYHNGGVVSQHQHRPSEVALGSNSQKTLLKHQLDVFPHGTKKSMNATSVPGRHVDLSPPVRRRVCNAIASQTSCFVIAQPVPVKCARSSRATVLRETQLQSHSDTSKQSQTYTNTHEPTNINGYNLQSKILCTKEAQEMSARRPR